MTDKEQIIINGVDVSGCLFYQSNFEEDYEAMAEWMKNQFYFILQIYDKAKDRNNAN